MAKILIIYYSKYGTTKKYAEWIAEELNGEICSVNNINQKSLGDYDIIIIGSSLYAGKIKGIDIIVKNFEILKNKKLIIFTCGLADYSKSVHINSIYNRLKKEFPEKIIEKLKIFYLRGGINYKELTIKDKFLMWMMRKMILKSGKEKLSEEDKEFIETYGKKIYFLEKNNINELLRYCK